jgi:hypothetical protein
MLQKKNHHTDIHRWITQIIYKSNFFFKFHYDYNINSLLNSNNTGHWSKKHTTRRFLVSMIPPKSLLYFTIWWQGSNLSYHFINKNKK